MSYDGWIVLPDPDGGEDVELAEFGNYTSNVSRMWGWCVSLVTEQPMRLSDTDGWPVDRAAPVFAKAAAVMEAERPRLEEWNPGNGWGDYDGALTYLRNVAATCAVYRNVPGAVVRWWV